VNGPGELRWRELPTLGDLLVRAAHTAPDPSAGIVTPDGRTTWAQLLADAERLAEQLHEHGVTRGSHVAVVADCSAEGVRILFACAFLGAVAVPVNTRFAVPEVRHVLADAEIGAVVVTAHPGSPADFPALVRAAVPGLESAPDPARLALDGLSRLRLAAVVADPASVPSGFVRPSGFVPLTTQPGPDPAETAARVAAWRALVALRDTALMVYTSGTTAHPRGCPLSHDAVVGVGVGVGRDRFRCTPHDVLWDVLPLFHLSFLNPLLAIMDAGGTFVTDRSFDAGRALAQIRDERVTVAFTCFPTVMDALLARPEFGEAFSGVRLMLNVGPPDTLRAIQARAPGTVQLTSYGSSEVGGIGATTGPDDPDDIRLGTNGLPLPGMEMAAVDPATAERLAPGEVGEIVVRGTAAFSGYGRPGPDRRRPDRRRLVPQRRPGLRRRRRARELPRPTQGDDQGRRRERVRHGGRGGAGPAPGRRGGGGGRGARRAVHGGAGRVRRAAPGVRGDGRGPARALPGGAGAVQGAAPPPFRRRLADVRHEDPQDRAAPTAGRGAFTGLLRQSYSPSTRSAIEETTRCGR
jgi:fatty-acyl-CoA synthase